MNILADECIAFAIIDRLRADGHSVQTAQLGTKDDNILAKAAAANEILLTADKDFGELVYRLRRAHAGVVLLRLAGLAADVRAELVSLVFQERSSELAGNFTVIEPDNLRIRKTPLSNA